MNSIEFERMINRIYKTADEELVCDQVRELVPAYVDSLVAEVIPVSQFSEIRLHLDQCSDCADLAESLYQVAKLDADNTLPAADILLDGLAQKTQGN